MELVSVYVTFGAISLVRSEITSNFVTPVHDLPRNQTYTGDWKYHNEAETEGVKQAGDKTNHNEVDVEKLKEKRKGFPQMLDQMKTIFHRCKTIVNKRLKYLMKNKVKSRVSELKIYASSIYQCVKIYSFHSLEDILKRDFIQMTDFVYFVKDGINVTEDLPSGRRAAITPKASFREFATYVLARDWTALAADWMENLLRTHSLKFHLNGSLVSQGRGRRRDHRMFAMMVMGFMIMASILIPMGFQFLTVLGGKSLLLAKMALIMSAINGLKKIATSNVGYGFYHTGSDGHHHEHLHHGFHEKHYHGGPPNYNNLQGYN